MLSSLLRKIRNEIFKPGSPVLMVAISTIAILIWIFWAATSSFWALWAGAAELRGTAVSVETSAAGAWGDSFGPFNALVGALGFGAVAITLNLQYRSLEKQKLDQHVSRFEENFFRLVDLMRSLRSSLKYKQTPKYSLINKNYEINMIYTGNDAIELAYHEVNHWIFKEHSGRTKILKNVVSSKYDSYVHNRFESCFAPYFRIIYTILYNIKNDEILSEDQKYFYANILRSQLTSFEIGLLAFNATSNFAKDLDDLIIYFRLLKYLPKKRRRVLGNIFPPEAYQARS